MPSLPRKPSPARGADPATAAGLRPAPIPQHGLIKGGVMDGWHYALIRVVDERASFQVFMELKVSEPDWPFPRFVKVRPWWDFTRLVPDETAPRRERAKVLDWNELLADAVQVALDAEMNLAARPASR